MKRLFGLVLVLFILLMAAAPVMAEEKTNLILSEQMTFQQLANQNGLEVKALLNKLGLTEKDASMVIRDAAKEKSLSLVNIESEARKLLVETQMEKSKNWQLIFAKFVLWVLLVVIISTIISLKKTVKYKPLWLLGAVVVFGVILGSDPNPLGVVKDGIVLYANEGVLFKPRFVALGFLLILTLIFSRVFCGWGCQIGSLQELGYMLPTKKIKLPFFFTNFIRILVFALMVGLAFGFHLDWLGYIDPFKIYSFDLSTYTYWLIGFFAAIVIGSLFIYRPWCTFACPFGLLSWLVNKISFLKLRFDQKSCIHCDACIKACPTGACNDLRNDSAQGDCFVCNRCQEVCPTDAIHYGKRKGVLKQYPVQTSIKK